MPRAIRYLDGTEKTLTPEGNVLNLRKLQPENAQHLTVILDELKATPRIDTIVIAPPIMFMADLLRDLPPSVTSIRVLPNLNRPNTPVSDGDLEELMRLLPEMGILSLRFDNNSFTEAVLIQLAEVLEDTQLAELYINSALTIKAAQAFIRLASEKKTFTYLEYARMEYESVFGISIPTHYLSTVRASLEAVLDENASNARQLRRSFTSDNVETTFNILMQGISPLDSNARCLTYDDKDPARDDTLLHYAVKNNNLKLVHILLYAAYLFEYTDNLYYARNKAGKIAADYIVTGESSEQIRALLEKAKNNEPIEAPSQYKEIASHAAFNKNEYLERIKSNPQHKNLFIGDHLSHSGTGVINESDMQELFELLIKRDFLLIEIYDKFKEERHFRLLCKTLPKTTLTTLYLDNDAVNPKYLTQLSRILSKTKINTLNLHNRSRIGWDHNEKNPDVLSALNLMIKENPGIKVVEIKFFSISDNNLMKFINNISAQSTLTTLKIYTHLENNPITVTMPCLIALVKRVKTLTEVSMPKFHDYPRYVRHASPAYVAECGKLKAELESALAANKALLEPAALTNTAPVPTTEDDAEPSDTIAAAASSSTADRFRSALFNKAAPDVELTNLAASVGGPN